MKTGLSLASKDKIIFLNLRVHCTMVLHTDCTSNKWLGSGLYGTLVVSFCSKTIPHPSLCHGVNVGKHQLASQLSTHWSEHIEFAVYEKLYKMYKIEIYRKVEMVDNLIIFTVEHVIKYNNNNNIHICIYLWQRTLSITDHPLCQS